VPGRSWSMGPLYSPAGNCPAPHPLIRGVSQHDHPAVGLGARRAGEPDPGCGHPLVGRIEIIDLEEEADPPGDLLADDGCLLVPFGAGQQQAGGGPGRPDHDPALGTATPGCHGGRVFHQFEAQDADKEVDRRVLVLDHDRGKGEMHPASIGTGTFRARQGAFRPARG
jgi:hypothetical protein